MKRPRTLERNEDGSALATVLIFGVVIMVLIVGLLNVGKSGIAFSQKSVESRQAYIDAKSVIEFGKIEINRWEKRLEGFDKELDRLEKEYQELEAREDPEASASELSDKRDKINEKKDEKNKELNKHFKIYAKIENISETLVMLKDPVDPLENLPSEETLLTSGFAQVGELRIKGENKDITDQEQKDREDLKYEFTIETENLRRLLDYEVSFTYQEGEGQGGTEAPVMPDLPEMSSEPESPSKIEYIADSIKWIPGSIFTESQKVYAKFDGLERDEEDNQALTIDEPSNSLDIREKFEWINGKTLDMTAHNIKVSQAFPMNGSHKAKFNLTAVGKGKTPGQIRIIEPYNQNNQELNTMTADNIVFEQGLTLAHAGKLNIACKTLYVNGDVSLLNSSAVLDITADNVVINGDVYLSSASTITTKKNSEFTNVWIKGKTSLASNGSSIKHLNLNYLSSGDVDLQSGTELELKCMGLSKVEIKNVKADSSNVDFKINEVNYLKIGDIALGQDNQLTIKGAEGKSDNYVKAGSIEANTGNSYDIRAINLALFTCGDFELNDNSTLELESDCILIEELSLLRTGNSTIETNYLDVSDETSINRTNGLFTVKPLGTKDLNIRFKGEYEQENSKVFIDQANMVIFADEFELDSDSAGELSLKVQADDILINSEMEIKQHWNGSYSGFEYSGKTSSSSSTNLHLQNNFIWSPQTPSYTIQKGTYKDVYGNFPGVKNKSPKNWLYELEPEPYQPSGELDLLLDKEKYYRGGS